ncbi:MAG: hypothetical protein ACM31O_10840 [Bacteroidota bacterium]|jgi:hypothetical protein
MSLRALPLIVISFILYNVMALFSGDLPTEEVFRKAFFHVPMLRGATWSFTWGDLVILVTMICLFAELIKSTYTSSASLVDHGLSMVVFIACLVEFLLVPQAATSVFFFIVVAVLIDVVAGFMIGIRVARRDLSIGHDT